MVALNPFWERRERRTKRVSYKGKTLLIEDTPQDSDHTLVVRGYLDKFRINYLEPVTSTKEIREITELIYNILHINEETPIKFSQNR